MYRKSGDGYTNGSLVLKYLIGSCCWNLSDTTGPNQPYRIFIRFLIRSEMCFGYKPEELAQFYKILSKSNNGKYLMVPTVAYHWKFIGFRPSDSLVIPSPGIRSDHVGCSDLIGPGVGFLDLGREDRNHSWVLMKFIYINKNALHSSFIQNPRSVKFNQ